LPESAAIFNAVCESATALAADTAASTERKSFLENDAGNRVVFGMAERDQGRSYAALCGKCFGRSGKNQKRFATGFFSDVDATPTHRFAYPGAERFCYRFLPGEARSQMALRKFHRHRVFDFAIRENAMQKPISESINGTPNARALHKIDTNPDHAHLELLSR
jgi:hypothetical protein